MDKMNFLNCYICNTLTQTERMYPMRAKTKYSHTPIYAVVKKFLKPTHLLRFTANDVICELCCRKLNQYDLACQTTEELERQITDMLYATEQAYLNEVENVEFLDVDDQVTDAEKCQKDFDTYQQMYDTKYAVGNKSTIKIELNNDAQNANIHAEDEAAMVRLESTEDSLDYDDVEMTTDLSIGEGETTEFTEEDFNDECTNFSGKSSKKREKNTRLRDRIKCSECDEHFASKRGLTSHQLRHHKLKKCGICQATCANLMELRDHNRITHEIKGDSQNILRWSRHTKELAVRENDIQDTINYRCDLCGWLETSETALNHHIELHENSLKCVICSTVVKHKGNLILHMRIHTDQKFFQCDKCGKEFVHKSSLRMHLQTTHTDIRSKQCSECPLSFKTKSQLNQHLVTHTGIKKHQCPECGKSFAQRYNMTAHYRLHRMVDVREKITYQCPVCKLAFAKPAQLKVHFNRTHDMTDSANNKSTLQRQYGQRVKLQSNNVVYNLHN